MNFFERIRKAFTTLFPSEQGMMEERGREFEVHIAKMFSRQDSYFSILDMQTDNYDKRNGLNVESNQDPDLLIAFRYTGGREEFAVECKYRLHPITSEETGEDVVGWSYPDQIRRYNNYSRREKIPVFIVIGLGGNPNKPEHEYCIPLEEAISPELSLSVLERYERIPTGKDFIYSDRDLR
jgi:hypothetical protein